MTTQEQELERAPAQANDRRIRVAIIGGGLAGMAAAYRLLHEDVSNRFEITIYEMSDRLGGKAGATRWMQELPELPDRVRRLFGNPSNHYEDHGYHILPQWYVNTWKIIKRIGFERNFKPFEK